MEITRTVIGGYRGGMKTGSSNKKIRRGFLAVLRESNLTRLVPQEHLAVRIGTEKERYTGSRGQLDPNFKLRIIFLGQVW